MRWRMVANSDIEFGFGHVAVKLLVKSIHKLFVGNIIILRILFANAFKRHRHWRTPKNLRTSSGSFPSSTSPGVDGVSPPACLIALT